MKITKTQIGILLFNIIYLLISLFFYIGKKNYEFLGYIWVVGFFIIFVSLLTPRSNENSIIKQFELVKKKLY